MLDVALTPVGGRVAAAILVTVLMVWLWRLRREGEQSPAFQWSLGAVQATTLVMIPMFAPYNQVLLAPCVMLIAKAIQDVWRANRMSRFFVLLTGTAIAWPWVASLTLAIAPDLVAINYSAAGVAGAHGIDSDDSGFNPGLDFCEQKDHVRRIRHCAHGARARKMLIQVLLARYCGAE